MHKCSRPKPIDSICNGLQCISSFGGTITVGVNVLPPVMMTSVVSVSPTVAQTPVPANSRFDNPWMFTTGGLLILLIALGVYSHLQVKKAAERLEVRRIQKQGDAKEGQAGAANHLQDGTQPRPDPLPRV